MEFKIELKEKELDLALEWLGCQDKSDTKMIILDHDLDLDVSATDAALASVFLELRDKCPIEYKYNKIKDNTHLDYELATMKEDIDRIYAGYELYKEHPNQEEVEHAIEQFSNVLHTKINEYNDALLSEI